MCAFADLVSRRCTHTYTSICVSIGGGWWRFGARARRSPFSIVRLQLPLSGGKFRWKSGWGKRILFLGYNGAFSTFPPPLFFLLVLGVLVVFFRLGVVCCEGLAPAGIYRAGVGAQPGGTGSIQADAVGRGG